MNMVDKGNVGNFALIIFIIAGTLFILTKKADPNYPSDYAMISPEVEFPYSIIQDTITFSIPQSEINKTHIIYAVINDSLQYGLLDPTLSDKLIITKGTYASYVANIKGNKIIDYQILKTFNNYKEKIDFYDVFISANKNGRKCGIQRCLSPFCNICVDECREVKGDERIAIDLILNDRGEIVPIYHPGYCPRCGRCFVECPIGLLVQSGDFDEKPN